MANEETMVPESIVNKMIGSALTNYRLDVLDRVVCELKELLVAHMEAEPRAIVKVLEKIEDSSKERRNCEARLIARLDENRNEVYKNFVQMRHLKIAVTLVISTILLVGGFQAWSSKTSNERFYGTANKELLLKIDTLTKKLEVEK